MLCNPVKSQRTRDEDSQTRSNKDTHISATIPPTPGKNQETRDEEEEEEYPYDVKLEMSAFLGPNVSIQANYLPRMRPQRAQPTHNPPGRLCEPKSSTSRNVQRTLKKS